MKFEPDLAREILTRLEDLPYTGGFHLIGVDGAAPEAVSYHVLLLHEAGLVEAMNLSTVERPEWCAVRLTHQGHEFIGAASRSDLWGRAQAAVLKASGSVTLEALKIALGELVKRGLQF